MRSTNLLRLANELIEEHTEATQKKVQETIQALEAGGALFTSYMRPDEEDRFFVLGFKKDNGETFGVVVELC